MYELNWIEFWWIYIINIICAYIHTIIVLTISLSLPCHMGTTIFLFPKNSRSSQLLPTGYRALLCVALLESTLLLQSSNFIKDEYRRRGGGQVLTRAPGLFPSGSITCVGPCFYRRLRSGILFSFLKHYGNRARWRWFSTPPELFEDSPNVLQCPPVFCVNPQKRSPHVFGSLPAMFCNWYSLPICTFCLSLWSVSLYQRKITIYRLYLELLQIKMMADYLEHIIATNQRQI